MDGKHVPCLFKLGFVPFCLQSGGGYCWSILQGALVEKYFVQHLIGNDFKIGLLGLRVF